MDPRNSRLAIPEHGYIEGQQTIAFDPDRPTLIIVNTEFCTPDWSTMMDPTTGVLAEVRK